MRCASIFPCVMTIIFIFSMIYIFSKLFGNIFREYNILFHLHVILLLHLLTVSFFPFQKQLYFWRVFLKKHKTFSYDLFHDIKYVYFLYDQIPQIVDMECPQGICLPIFVVKEFSGLFARPSIFFNQRLKVSVNNIWHFIWFHILIKFYTSFFSDGITTSQKCLSLHTFSWNLSLFSVLKKFRQFRQ